MLIRRLPAEQSINEVGIINARQANYYVLSLTERKSNL